ncbi:hypothetical protein TNCV_4666721 [Trichonephila clavipes]|nr:hypothetical protein TNCV_4666721 [Trichonephila clavipes]
MAEVSRVRVLEPLKTPCVQGPMYIKSVEAQYPPPVGVVVRAGTCHSRYLTEGQITRSVTNSSHVAL